MCTSKDHVALSSTKLHCELVCSAATLSSRVFRRGTASRDEVPHSRATADLLVDVQDMTFLVLKQTLSVFAQLTVPSGVI